MKAFYADSIKEFLVTDKNVIVGQLSAGYAHARFHQLIATQIEVWSEEISIIKEAFKSIGSKTDFDDWHILFEYPIPRRGKRIDVVILTKSVVMVLEFKIGATKYLSTDRMQVEDYCLDLRDFHAESRDAVIIPVLVATDTISIPWISEFSNDNVKSICLSNRGNLSNTIENICNEFHGAFTIDPLNWEDSDYKPTPTIIEAAQTLYSGQNVREISRSHAGVENLTKTSEAIFHAIEQAQLKDEKLICFITGVPGSGKTLAGLNIVHNRKLHDGDLGVFLSGNGPLVRILSEALARDDATRNGKTLVEARHEVTTFIHNVHKFLDEYHYDKSKVPIDRIVVFDEAQRAWDREQAYRKFKRDFSEPEMILEIMDRHPGWAVFIALIGGGQEINSGEAGLSEWGRNIADKFKHWKVMISPELKQGHHSTGGQTLFNEVPEDIILEENEDLHLDVCIRSYRAEQTSNFVANILDINIEVAQIILKNDLSSFEIVLTRSLDKAKDWLKKRQRGSRRIGLTASSGARRIKAYGLEVKNKLDEVNWFLNPPDDVRSSFYLEDVATEFAIQGLELDWTCLCWGADLRFANERWEYKSFRGTKWQDVHKERTREYVLNKYRVLLTRAREGLVIWIPQGDKNDSTRPPEFYDSTADYLSRCGIPYID